MHKNNDQAGTNLLAEALAVFDLMLVGCSLQCFGDYQNGDGETIGPRMDALHAALRGQQAPIQSAELAELRKLAEAATPGMWEALSYGRIVGGPLHHYVNGSAKGQIASCSVTFHEQAPDDEPERQQANADFIAAVSPAAVLRLLDALAAAPAQQQSSTAPAHALTDAEIEEMWDAQWSYHGHEPCKLGHVEFARAIAAHLARKG